MNFLLLISAILITYGSNVVQGKTFYLNTANTVNWYTASEQCALQGKQLATVNNKAENDQIKQLLTDAKMTNNFFWISATDNAKEGSFVWFSTGCNVTFSDFDPAPNNYNGNENCVHFWLSVGYGNRLSWNDLDCLSAHYYICEDKTCGKCGDNSNNNNNNNNNNNTNNNNGNCGCNNNCNTCGNQPGLVTTLLNLLL